MVQGCCLAHESQPGLCPINFPAIAPRGVGGYILFCLYRWRKQRHVGGNFLPTRTLLSTLHWRCSGSWPRSLVGFPLSNIQSTLNERRFSKSQICIHLLSAENLSSTEWEVPLAQDKMHTRLNRILSIVLKLTTSLCLSFLSSSVKWDKYLPKKVGVTVNVNKPLSTVF